MSNVPRREKQKERRKKLPLLTGIGIAGARMPTIPIFIYRRASINKPARNDKILSGVTMGAEHEHKVGQFADDTAAMLERYQQLKKLFEIMNKWERTTAYSIKNSTI